jgi:hypothetical protein
VTEVLAPLLVLFPYSHFGTIIWNTYTVTCSSCTESAYLKHQAIGWSAFKSLRARCPMVRKKVLNAFPPVEAHVRMRSMSKGS